MRVQSLDWEDPLEKESQPTVVFLPGKFRGQRSLVCYNPGGLKVVNQDSATDHTHTHTQHCQPIFHICIKIKLQNSKYSMSIPLSILYSMKFQGLLMNGRF